MLCKSMDWFLYDKDGHHQRVKRKIHILTDFEISYLKPVIMDKLAICRHHALHSQGRIDGGTVSVPSEILHPLVMMYLHKLLIYFE